MSCKSHKDTSKKCRDGPCQTPYIPNLRYCDVKDKTPLNSCVKSKKNGELICASSLTKKGVMDTYSYCEKKTTSKPIELEPLEPVKLAEPVKTTEPVKTAEQVKLAEPVKTAEPEKSEQKEPDRLMVKDHYRELTSSFTITHSNNKNSLIGEYRLDVGGVDKIGITLEQYTFDIDYMGGILYRHVSNPNLYLVLGAVYGDPGKFYRTWWIVENDHKNCFRIGPFKQIKDSLKISNLCEIRNIMIKESSSRIASRTSKKNYRDLYHQLDKHSRNVIDRLAKKTAAKGVHDSRKRTRRHYLGGGITS